MAKTAAQRAKEYRARKRAEEEGDELVLADDEELEAAEDPATPVATLRAIQRSGKSEMARIQASRTLMEHDAGRRQATTAARVAETTEYLLTLPMFLRIAFLEVCVHSDNPVYGTDEFPPVFATADALLKLLDGFPGKVPAVVQRILDYEASKPAEAADPVDELAATTSWSGETHEEREGREEPEA